MWPFATLVTISASLACARVRCSPRDTPQCPIIFDGRVPANATITDFDSADGGGWNPFNPDYVKGGSLQWSDILLLPNTSRPSLFDTDSGTIAVEVTISDESIFEGQTGFRRAGLLFEDDDNNNSPASQGVATLHFSVMQDASRALNLSHEYLNVWHETADYSANQFNFEAGTIIGQESLTADTFKLLNRNNEMIWSTTILQGTWQNFAVTLDFNENTLQLYYSEESDALTAATEAVSNDNSGDGQYQIGILKKPTGTSDVVYEGYQESGIDEGQIYGAIFIEDSSGGCVSM